jgi:broad specificity phosphatase PhoE
VVAKKELDMVTRAIRASVAGDKLPDDDQSGPLLYVLRHGSTQLNTEGKFRGWIDVSLDDAGRKQAEEAGKWLKDKGIGLIVSSPLKRSRETADIAAKAIGVSVGADEELLPWNLGELAGTSKADNMDRLNHYIDNPSEPIPGGESLNAFLARYHKLMRTYLAKATSESPVMLSAHTSNVIASDKFVDEESEGRPEGVDSVGPGGIYAIWKEGSAYRGGPVFGAVRPGDFKS